MYRQMFEKPYGREFGWFHTAVLEFKEEWVLLFTAANSG